MSDYRDNWIKANGPIPKGMHIHHILPRYLGGGDEVENLQLVTPEEHYDIHFERGEHGACALLSDGIDREAPTKPVVQFNLDGHRIDEFESFNNAAVYLMKKFPMRYLSSHVGKISDCCRYRAKSYRNYQWFYESEVGDIDYIGPVKRIRDKGIGHDTSGVFLMDSDTLCVFKSKNSHAKFVCGDDFYIGAYNRKECNDRRIKITEEEYYYLQELKAL